MRIPLRAAKPLRRIEAILLAPVVASAQVRLAVALQAVPGDRFPVVPILREAAAVFRDTPEVAVVDFLLEAGTPAADQREAVGQEAPRPEEGAQAQLGQVEEAAGHTELPNSFARQFSGDAGARLFRAWRVRLLAQTVPTKRACPRIPQQHRSRPTHLRTLRNARVPRLSLRVHAAP